MDLEYFAGAKKVRSCSRLSKGLWHKSNLMSSSFKGWAAILVWKLSEFTAFRSVLTGRKVLSVLPLSVFHASFSFLREFQFCSHIVSECNVQQNSSHS